MKPIIKFLLKLITLSFNQLIDILGFFIIATIVLYTIKHFTIKYFKKKTKNLFYCTAIIGCPIHEFSHYIFSLLFKHKVRDMKLFIPDPRSKVLGYVDSVHNKKSLYQTIGTFFVSIAPIIGGAITLYLLLCLLVPNNQMVFNIIQKSSFKMLNTAGLLNKVKIFLIINIKFFKILFSLSNFKAFRFWIFLYLSLSISIHMCPSIPDISNMWVGLATIFSVMMLSNLVAISINYDINKIINWINQKLTKFNILLIYSIIVSLLNFVLSFIMLTLYSLRKGFKLKTENQIKISNGPRKLGSI